MYPYYNDSETRMIFNLFWLQYMEIEGTKIYLQNFWYLHLDVGITLEVTIQFVRNLTV